MKLEQHLLMLNTKHDTVLRLCSHTNRIPSGTHDEAQTLVPYSI